MANEIERTTSKVPALLRRKSSVRQHFDRTEEILTRIIHRGASVGDESVSIAPPQVEGRPEKEITIVLEDFPFVRDGAILLPKSQLPYRVRGPFAFSERTVDLVRQPVQCRRGGVMGWELVPLLRELPVLGVQIGLFLSVHPEFLPESFSGHLEGSTRRIVFWGDLFQYKKDLCVSVLTQDLHGQVQMSLVPANSTFGKNAYAAVARDPL